MQRRESARGRPVWCFEGEEEARRAGGSRRERRHRTCVSQTSENGEKDAAEAAAGVLVVQTGNDKRGNHGG